MSWDREEGLREIEQARWHQQESWLVLVVHDERLRAVQCYLSLRPTYCDRGHIQLEIEGPLDLDHADSFPRYFFCASEADLHTRTFLKWRLWKERMFSHSLDLLLESHRPMTWRDE
jgi:hypothetical protein